LLKTKKCLYPLNSRQKKEWLSKCLQNLSNPFHILRWINKQPQGALTFTEDGQNFIDSQMNAAHLLDNLVVDDSPDSKIHLSTKNHNVTFLNQQISMFPAVTTSEVLSALQSMKPFAAPGPDSTRTFMFQWTKLVVSPVLASIFTSCFALLYFPNELKKGNLRVIPKPHARSFDSLIALCPISLLNVLGKFLEKKSK
jgi:hypothetical protein